MPRPSASTETLAPGLNARWQREGRVGRYMTLPGFLAPTSEVEQRPPAPGAGAAKGSVTPPLSIGTIRAATPPRCLVPSGFQGPRQVHGASALQPDVQGVHRGEGVLEQCAVERVELGKPVSNTEHE